MKQRRPILWCIAFTVLAAAAATGVKADSEALDRAAIQQEVRATLQQLIDEGMLDQAIERGISNYVKKQRALARESRQRQDSAKARNVRPVSDKDYVYGSRAAPITLVEYSDFECPFCKRFHMTAKQLVDRSGGQVNWVYRHFPLEFHNPGAQKQAEASECAGKLGGAEAFWRYTDLIYERTSSNGKGFPIGKLVPLAMEIGLDKDVFESCLDSGEMAAKVLADYENGQASGVSGTPGNVLLHNETGDAVVMAGALPLARLQAAVKALQQAQAAKQ